MDLVVGPLHELLQGGEPPSVPVILKPEPLQLPVRLQVVDPADHMAYPLLFEEALELGLSFFPSIPLRGTVEFRPTVRVHLPYRQAEFGGMRYRLPQRVHGMLRGSLPELPSRQDLPAGIVFPQDHVGVLLGGAVIIPVQQRATVLPLVPAPAALLLLPGIRTAPALALRILVDLLVGELDPLPLEGSPELGRTLAPALPLPLQQELLLIG